jgi:molybdopterin synthase sulfur carrier subunit
MIKVLFFAKLREQLGCAELSIDELSLDEGVSDIAALKQQIITKLGGNSAVFLSADNILCSINHELAENTALIKAGDEVAFFPPVTGG